MLSDILMVPHGFRIQDLFDILIITTIIYGLLVWFRDTASRFVLGGISLIGIVYILARQFQLYLTAVVLQSFFAIILFALVVIFQEELRRFFERIAIWGRLHKKERISSHYEEAEIIAQTVASLAKKRFGALIVLRAEDPLDRHLTGGNTLEGILSQPLLESIFDPHSIGHDGAVIIEDGRVTKFGCHLPLSTNAEKYGSLGLRHTAALGLTERSDALCVVVSEERGTISIANKERLEVLKSAAELKMVLQRFYGDKVPGRKKSKRIAGWFRKNTLEKGVAVFLAVLLWFLFGYQREFVQRDFIVPIEYRNLASEWILEGPTVTETKVLLKGPAQAFNLLSPAHLKMSVDLAGIREGKQEVELSAEMIKTPSSIAVLDINPKRIAVSASRLHSRLAPVEVRTEGTLAAGLILQKIEVKPLTIPILVPRRLRGVDILVPTETIDLRRISKTTTLTPRLMPPTEVYFEGGKAPAVEVVIRVKARSAAGR
ncbi:MAG TPA: diadenylate cyclase [Syntrophales bacterium]|nr:diadenylate cyclase [Syntrophales bacterium]HOX93376.1 diadenylate cyclase [Syntrophales bacterium]HPI56079.1 diadenylate cyclase [Syntrophales bacterium]HPN24031.1 diadenylate cyclase [Syntrophales bacterium]HQM28310.1 diadenylate cyclase [Syntrophales bacterium]